MLISEPATCPYCQQPDFGVTYNLPPPFRRGLAYAGTTIKASSPVTSLASNADEGRAIQTPQSGRRRTISVSASAPGVITTDIIRPEWATKLATARNHMARRSAAATALHTAAYLIGDGSNSRSFSFASRSRFARSRSGDASVDPAELSPTGDAGGDFPQLHTEARPTQRRSRVDDIEEMMVMEAIRLSLAAEEERNRQTEKQAVKDAKKKAKEDKKHEKLQEKRDRKDRRSVYGGNSLSGSGSALSLSLSGIGRRRNNSGGSNMAREPTLEGDASNEGKGKAVDRGSVSSSVHGNNGSWPLPQTLTTSLPASSEPSHSATSPTAPERPSHLRTVSNASNMSNSSSENSTRDKGMNFTAGSSGLGGLPTPDFSGSDPLFNYDALARMISRGEEAEPIIDYPMASSIDTSGTPMQRAEGQDASTVQPSTSLPGREVPRPVLLAATPEMPELKVTPETPVLPAQQYA